MKKIFNHYWISILLGLIISILGIIAFGFLAFISILKHSGLPLLGGGDNSPITLILATIFVILVLTFPATIWFLLNKFVKFNKLSNKIKNVFFIIFVFLPLWTYLIWIISQLVVNKYNSYKSVTKACVIKNGINRFSEGKNTKEVECKNGTYHGIVRTYNSKGILINENHYLNGKKEGKQDSYNDNGKINSSSVYKKGVPDGADIIFNENGSTSHYSIKKGEESKTIYYSGTEDYYLNKIIDLKNQELFCKNQDKYLSTNYSYYCLGNFVNGDFIEFDSRGQIIFKVKITNGIFDGVYEKFKEGKIQKHYEFKNGILDGRVFEYNNDTLKYEGQYVNGLQEGIFRRYDYKGNLESEVEFQNGIITKINFP